MVRKIPPDLENPIDNILIEMGEYLSEYFKKLNLTANDLTTVSTFTGLYSIYLFIKKKYVMSAIFFIISHSFDCFDGFYARKYNMVSNFGDCYDHLSDYIIDGLMIYLIIKKYLKLPNNNLKKYIPILLIPLIGLMLVHFGCQEMYFDSTTSGNIILDCYKPMCPIDRNKSNDLRNFIKFSRFFGTGTYTLFICILILSSYSIDNDIH